MGINQSMGRVGSALDNTVIESWHSALEFDVRTLERFATKAEARIKVTATMRQPRGACSPAGCGSGRVRRDCDRPGAGLPASR